MKRLTKNNDLYGDSKSSSNKFIQTKYIPETTEVGGVLVEDDYSIFKELEYGFNIDESIIFIHGDIVTGHLVDFMVKCRTILSNRPEDKQLDPITLVLNTDGGEVYEALGMIDYMRTLPVKVNVIARGRAFSAGALLLACGTGIRAASQHTYIMIHELSSGNVGKATDLKSNAAHIEQLDMVLYKLFEETTGKKVEYWEKIARKDFYIDAKTAKDLGIIDQII
jgi:ATP-dependent Clp protease protease subunit